jgi:DNA-binding NtrC family response regulator
VRKPHVLVVDDSEGYRAALERMLARAGYSVATARDGAEALATLAAHATDLVLCDVKMPGISGHELVRQVHDVNPDLPCIVITGSGGGEASLEALQAGAYWYLEKNSDSSGHDVLRKLVAQAIEHGRLKAENRSLQRQLQSRYGFDQLVGASETLQRVLERVERVADTDSTVLITGESGSGKELIARAIHFGSRRAERSFVTVNCGAIPEELLESELFGHVRGAFTNAIASREGRFALAHGGTIFLDEIGDMSPTLQVKLLRVLRDRSFEPVGSSQTQRVDTRVIAATHQNLALAIKERRFREDLFYRLNVIPIEMPPLRARKDDIPLLVNHFLKKVQEERHVAACSLERDALALLCAYDWPGNVRELENTMERLVVLKGGGAIGVDDLPASLRDLPALSASSAPRFPETGLPLTATVDRFESDLIRQALERTGWNKNQAAKLLEMNRTTLLEKIKKHGLSADK